VRTPAYLCCSFAVTACLVACSPARIAMGTAEMSRLQSEPAVHAVAYAPAHLSFRSAGDNAATALGAGAVGALGGGLGGVLVGLHARSRAVRRGDEMSRAYSLQDPAPKVRDAFLASATSRTSLKNLLAITELLPSDEFKAIEKKVGNAAVLDFKTDSWRLVPGTLSGAYYRMKYRMRIRFLRVADSTVIWQDYCVFDDTKSKATLEELTARGGILLRDKIDEAADFCAQTLLDQVLKNQN
jgi:hypothetical protein